MANSSKKGVGKWWTAKMHAGPRPMMNSGGAERVAFHRKRPERKGNNRDVSFLIAAGNFEDCPFLTRVTPGRR